MKRISISLIVVSLAGCAQLPFPNFSRPAAAPAPTSAETRPQTRPDSASLPKPPPTARTAEDFDTTSAADRKAAMAAPAPTSGGGALGKTIAALGDVTDPGFWIKTPLVKAKGKGTVSYAKSGRTVQVDLIPMDGPKTGGSQLSLATMRLLDVPLTELAEVSVTAE